MGVQMIMRFGIVSNQESRLPGGCDACEKPPIGFWAESKVMRTVFAPRP
jgi:hypothetical protein